jgi:peptidoglycan/xylan/chitin deacetylase (PgdA/CDA1 family)
MDRRALLVLLAAGTVSALGGWAGADLDEGEPPVIPDRIALEGAEVRPRPALLSATKSPLPSPVPPAHRRPVKPVRPSVVDKLPLRGHGHARDIALTIDDGTDTAVVKAFLDFARHTGVKLTFFPNGVYRSWTDHAAQLRALVEAGQVQVGNHTWSHPDLLRCSDRDVADQINHNDGFFHHLLGVSPKPWFRPPYGLTDARVERIAADHGYPRITLWNGTFGDDVVLSPAALIAEASVWLQPGRIVVGHANHDPVTHVYGQLVDVIRHRRLQTRTLHEAFQGVA